MNQWQLRFWREGDLPALRALWADAFGDDEAYIRAFHELFLRPGSCIVAQAEDQVVSAMYILEGPVLFPPADTAMSAAYTYALATDPAWRGRGIGTAVYRACVRSALERQDVVCVLPAERSLYDFYAGAAGARPVSYMRFAASPAAGPPPSVPESTFCGASPCCGACPTPSCPAAF